MENTSVEFKEELNNDNRRYIKACNITLIDGTVLLINNSQIWPDSFKHEDAVSNPNSFDIGSAIVGKFSLTLNNIYDDFSDYNFTDAVVSNVKVGLELPNGGIEYARKGVFTVDETSYNGSLITLECLDNMHKFDRPYSESKLLYPATLGVIVRDACSCCGVSLAADSATFENDDYVVDTRPDESTLTFRNILLWVGQISCHWCKCNANGELCLGWYDTWLLDKLISGFDGGTFAFEDWKTTLDGGTMNPWSTGDVEVEGGAFKGNGYHDIHSLVSMSICTDDVVVTGIKVVEKTDSDKNRTTLYGSEGYVLSIEGNEFIQNGKGTDVAEYLGEKLVGLQFRPLSVSCLSDPSMEAGDVAVVTDRKGNSYPTLITSTTFTAGNYQQISCDAETPLRKSAQRFSEATRIYQELRNKISRQKTEWEKAIEDLGNSLGVTSGLYSTIYKQENESNIFYLHDKPSLEESKVIWKMTRDAWGVSTDGGETWNGGMTVDGTLIARILTAIGINADWINTGTFTVKDQDGTIIFLADCDTGRVEIHPDVFTLSGKTIAEIAGAAIREKTNLLKDTVEFTADHWTTMGIISTGYEDPDGGTDAVRISRRQAGTMYLPGYLRTDPSNKPIRTTEQVYSLSVWLKASADTTVKMSLGDVEDTVNVATEWKRYTLSVDVGGELPSASQQVKFELMGREDEEGDPIHVYLYDPTVTYGIPEKGYTQEEIFNILTNNGASKGISLVDGQLYISFSIAQGDVLKLGGANNANGELVILDKDDNRVGYIDNTGVHFDKGTFKAAVITGSTISGTTILSEGENGYHIYIEGGNMYVMNGDTIVGKIHSTEVQTRIKGSGDFYTEEKVDGLAIESPNAIDILVGGETVLGLSYNLVHIKKELDIAENLNVYGGCWVGGMFNATGEAYFTGDTTFQSPPILKGLSRYDSGMHLVQASDGRICYAASSSERYKDIKGELTDQDVEALFNAKVVWAKYKDGYLAGDSERCGKYMPMFTAENIEEVFPIATDHKDGKAEDWNYRVLIPAMEKQIQVLKRRNDMLEKRIVSLEKICADIPKERRRQDGDHQCNDQGKKGQ